MTKPKISVVILAYNEALAIGKVVAGCKRFCDGVIVVDDGSIDETAKTAKTNGAVVVCHGTNLGVTKATRSGFEAAHGDIIVTMDADGQHNPSDIPRLVKPIIEAKVDLTLGVRETIPHRSERIINSMASLRVKCSDSGTGFRALKADLANKMRLHGACLCGTFVLEAHKHAARITEIPIKVRPRVKDKRKMRTRHVKQFFYVLRDLIF